MIEIKKYPTFVVLISANSEWRAVLEILGPAKVNTTPLGECFFVPIASYDVNFFHSGWGKTRSAAATQYVIDHWKPDFVINLGTCGGLKGHAELNEILLVTDTVMYDVIERMGDSHLALDFYRARLDTGWIGSILPANTRRSPLASADQDIDFQNFSMLTNEFGVPGADWESSAIAWVLNANRVDGLILRGVSDIISPTSSETDNNHALWRSRVVTIIQKLIDDLPFYLEKFRSRR